LPLQNESFPKGIFFDGGRRRNGGRNWLGSLEKVQKQKGKKLRRLFALTLFDAFADVLPTTDYYS